MRSAPASPAKPSKTRPSATRPTGTSGPHGGKRDAPSAKTRSGPSGRGAPPARQEKASTPGRARPVRSPERAPDGAAEARAPARRPAAKGNPGARATGRGTLERRPAGGRVPTAERRESSDRRPGPKIARPIAPWSPMGQRRRQTAMRRALETSLRWAVFELNDENLWTRVRATVESLLTQEWHQGALMGATADQAFFVRCDATTMNEFEIARGQLVVLVGLAFVKSAEFSILRIEQNTVT